MIRYLLLMVAIRIRLLFDFMDMMMFIATTGT